MKSLPKGQAPYPDFPLTYHAGSGQWKKKINGRVIYFGSDPIKARDKWLAEKDHWLAGRNPRQQQQAQQTSAVTMDYLAQNFLYARECLVDSGEMRRATWQDYKSVCKLLVAHFGRDRLVAEIGPNDFRALRASFAKGRGLVSLWNLVTRTRAVFNFAKDEYKIEPNYGQGFDKPSREKLREERDGKRKQHGLLMFSADDVDKLLAVASKPLRAMILLGLNAALGNTDILSLNRSSIVGHGKGQWLDYPRRKTGVQRRIPLWPETIQAINNLDRPEPANKSLADRVFLTETGEAYRMDYISEIFCELMVSAGLLKREKKKIIGRHGLNFYSLRRTFRTFADESRDIPAVTAIMGHAPASNDMGAIYNQGIDDERLIAVVDYVRQKLLGARVKVA